MQKDLDLETRLANTYAQQLKRAFPPVPERQEKKIKCQIGTSKEMSVSTGEFQGRRMKEKRGWIFLSRVKDTVTEDIIKQHIVQRLNLNSKEEVIVQNIETYHKVKDNKCFQIGVSFQFKDTVYENSFWPTGVLFSRYNFSLQPCSTGTNQNKTNFQLAVPSQGQP
ncbi:hypothetical protein HHI36_004604 [Cryptolaemus montrouzieri]|uniref:Uncharacterized protein n=1 Tax=Cryptolaemus montrouzieri TaxID=559131 RepID=A0ABD2NSB6_9CUCU